MSNKKKALLCIILFAGMVLTTVAMILWENHSLKQKDLLTPIKTETIEEEGLDLSLTDATTAPEDSEIFGYTYRVALLNPGDLYESCLPKKGYGLFESYISMYIDYYYPGDEIVDVWYVLDSAEHSSVATKFLIKVPELDLVITCLYKHAEESYAFYSELSGD